MKHFVRRMQAFAASLVVVAAGLQAQKAPRDMDRFIDQLMKKMTLEEKIGQLNLPVTGEITTGLFIDAAAHILRHGLERITLVNPRYAVVLYRQADWTALHVEGQNPLSLVVEKLKINIDLQFLNQTHAGTLRLVKSCTSDYAAGSLIRDAKYQLAAAIVRQSTAALRRLSKVKPIFGFLELDVFALFGFQKLLYSF